MRTGGKALIGTIFGAALGYLIMSSGMYFIYRTFRQDGVASEEAIFFFVSAFGGIVLGSITGLACGLSWCGHFRAAAWTCLIGSTVILGGVSLLFIRAVLSHASTLGQGVELLQFDRFGLLFVWNAALLLWGIWWRMRVPRDGR